MSEEPSEYLDDSDPIGVDDLNSEEPEVETVDEYGPVDTEPTDVPPPADGNDQNPGFVEGAHA